VNNEHPETLDQQATRVTSEARMVLPGVQAILGFQLVSVFSQRFELFNQHEQLLHLFALVLVAAAMGFIMAPAAYHRQAEFGVVSDRFVVLASVTMTVAMLPLAVGVCLDIYLVSRLVVGSPVMSALIAAGVGTMLFILWFAVPLGVRAARGYRRLS
jgi:hypothetical protein